LQSVKYKNGKPLEHKLVKQAISEGETRLGEAGRLVIRESGTEPVIRVMAEGDDPAMVGSVVDTLVGAIERAAAP